MLVKINLTSQSGLPIFIACIRHSYEICGRRRKSYLDLNNASLTHVTLNIPSFLASLSLFLFCGKNGGRPGVLHGISMIANSPVRNDPGLMCPSSGIDIQQIPGAPYWKAPPCEIPSRPGSQCNSSNILFQPNSPYNPLKSSKLSRHPPPIPIQSPTTSSCATTSTSPTSVASQLPLIDSAITYPSSIGSLVGPSNPLVSPFAGMNGGLLVNTSNTLGLLTPLDQVLNTSSTKTVLSQPQTAVTVSLNVPTTSTDRVRFGSISSNQQGNLNILGTSFVDDPPKPSFQQLVSV